MRILLLLFCFLIPLSSIAGKKEVKRDSTQHELEIVFCLDLSGSTNGLIEDLREHFWYITNQLKAMQPAPVVRMGVVGFSRPSFGKNNAYVKVLSDITPHLDVIAATIFSLRPSIEKGDQFVVPALQTSLALSWSKSPEVKKLIFLVGNGMATANGMAYEKIAETAHEKGVSIHTMYVTSNGNKIKEMPAWRRIADISGGLTTEITVGKQDSARVWKMKSDESIQCNKKLLQVMRWNVVEEHCREYSTTADSGAIATSEDEWMNRMTYKGSAQYYNFMAECGAFSTLDGRPAEKLEDDVFSRKIRESIQETQEALKNCGNSAPFEKVTEHHAYYKNRMLKEDGTFRKAVILFTMTAWGEITSPLAP